MQSINIH